MKQIYKDLMFIIGIVGSIIPEPITTIIGLLIVALWVLDKLGIIKKLKGGD